MAGEAMSVGVLTPCVRCYHARCTCENLTPRNMRARVKEEELGVDAYDEAKGQDENRDHWARDEDM